MIIRKAEANEYNFLVSPWHANLLAEHADNIERAVIEAECQPRIAVILARGTAVVAVDEDTGLLLGGLVYECSPVPVLHFAYTRKTHRRLGILKAILTHEKIVGVPSLASMHTSSLQYVVISLKASCFYNPWLFNGAIR